MKRPAGVYVISVLLLISCIIGIIIGLRGLGVNLPVLEKLQLIPGSPMFLPVGVISATMLVLSVLGIIISIGLFLLKDWARSAAITIASILIIGNLFFVMTGGFGLGRLGPGYAYMGLAGGGISILFNLIVIIYLLRGSVKEIYAK